MSRLSWSVSLEDRALAAAVDGLRHRLDGALRQGAVQSSFGPGGTRGGVRRPTTVVWADRPLSTAWIEATLRSEAIVVVAGPTLDRADPDGLLAAAAGLTIGTPVPEHDIRVRSGCAGGPLAVNLLDHSHHGQAHLGDHTHVRDRVLRVEKVDDDVEVLLTAGVGLEEHPLATWRPATGVLAWTLGTIPAAVESPAACRLLLLALRHALEVPRPEPVRVGLLGYGAIGAEHARAIRQVDGLRLAAVCDLSPERVAAALRAAPEATPLADPEALLTDDEVDLVIVSTPPNSHAAWALRALDAGKHVVLEKPFAITTHEADAVLAAARDRTLFAAVYQNRRFDPDHLAIRAAVADEAIGEVFHVEAFVGGYGHPCNLWHSDAGVSGGAIYDWGSHVLDQLLDLLPQHVDHVTALEHKRVWLDVTNADHARISMRFVGGAEATFVYSDLAAALKPRWYVLGTRGAIVGTWRSERIIGRSDVGTLTEDVLAPADCPPLLELYGADGARTRLPTPAGRPHRFHAELADALHLGLPTTVTGAQSRRVVAVMEAATASARNDGRPVSPR